MIQTITIQEKYLSENKFNICITFDNTNPYNIILENPHDKEIYREFEWYFEDYIDNPYSSNANVEKCRKLIYEYGERLFKGLFSNPKVYTHYKESVGEDGFENITIEIIGNSIEFQMIHWESLKDPDFDKPLSVQGVVFYRKNTNPKNIEAKVNPFPYINLLIVTSRPDEESDINYRTIQRPIIEVVRKARLKVKPYILRPGTYKSLVKHLDEVGNGFYHIIHFDVHGALLDYSTITSNPNRYVAKGRYGLKDVQPYDGKKAFLIFETDKKGEANPVSAGEITSLLETKQVPVYFLNACQSAKQEDSDNETSFGKELIQKGMQLVMAMRYSISVSASRILIEELYQQLFNGKNVEQAISLARKELYNNKNRMAKYNKTIELEDWLLPVVYKNRDVNFSLREFTREEEETFYIQKENRFKFEEPNYGFHGRDLDILKIEKMLLKHNQLLLQGLGGAGKTTLLTYLGWWWEETFFVKSCLYFSYDSKAWTLEQIIFEIAKRIYNHNKFSIFQSKLPAVQKHLILEELNSNSYALILDNAESITGVKLAIQNTLSDEDRSSLKDFLAQIKGKTFVIYGSRSDEGWLRLKTFRENTYILKGFDEETAYNFAESITKAIGQNFEELIEDFSFKRLIALLGGYPLALKAVLPHLRHHTPEKILVDLKAGDVDLDKNNLQIRTESIIKCIEYSHSNLSEDAQKLLLLLSPFQSTIIIEQDIFKNYFNILKETAIFKDYPFEKFDYVIKEAIQNGFMQEALQKNPIQIMTLQPAFTYFLKCKLNEIQDKTFAEQINKAFESYYINIEGILLQLLTSNKADEQKVGLFLTQLELENIWTIMEKSLDKQGSVIIPFNIIDDFFRISMNFKDRLTFAKMVLEKFERYPVEKLSGELCSELINILIIVGETYRHVHKYKEAKRALSKALELTNIDKNFDEKIAVIYAQLGSICTDLKKDKEAFDYFSKALDISIKINDKHFQACIYNSLGIIMGDLRKYRDSEDYFSKSLNIFIKDDDKLGEAEVYDSMGNMLKDQRKFEESIECYQKAVDIFFEFNDTDSIAELFCNLSLVFLELQDLGRCRDCLLEALALYISLDDKYSLGRVYHYLGKVSARSDLYSEAANYYQKAVETFGEFEDEYNTAKVIGSFGELLLKNGDYDKSNELFQKSLEIFSSFEDEYSVAEINNRIGELYLKSGDYTRSFEFFQNALNKFINLNDKFAQAKVFMDLGYHSFCLKKYEESRQYYKNALDICIEYDDYLQAKAYTGLSNCSRKLGEYGESHESLRKAITVYINYNDHKGIREALYLSKLLSDESKDSTIFKEIAEMFEVSQRELYEALENTCITMEE